MTVCQKNPVLAMLALTKMDAQSTNHVNFSPQKKMKLRGNKDLSIAAVGKYGTLQEFSFFDKVTGRTRVCRAGASGKGAGGGGELLSGSGRRAGTSFHSGRECGPSLNRWQVVRCRRQSSGPSWI